MRHNEPSDFHCAKHGMTAEKFRQTVIDAYSMLPGALDSEAGWVLQRKDSEMAERIMLHFVEQGVPALPIHDRFIIQLDRIVELQDVTKATFKEQFGQFPTVAIKTLWKQI